jgi:hypothetical protein
MSTKHKQTRKQKFKDLMKYRGTVEQGLTFNQIFCEVYSDVVEKYFRNGKWGSFGASGEFIATGSSGLFMVDVVPCLSIDDPIISKVRYLKRVMREAWKDDDFRWLSVSKPIKTCNKQPPYVEYRYINIKASETPELLSEINEYWAKRLAAITQGYNRTHQRLQRILDATSTPEGERQYEIAQDALFYEIDERLTMNIEIGRMVKELREEGKIPPRAYKQNVNYEYLSEVIREEVINKEALENIFKSLLSDDKDQRRREVRRLVKDTIEAYYNKHLKTELAKNAKIEDFGF